MDIAEEPDCGATIHKDGVYMLSHCFDRAVGFVCGMVMDHLTCPAIFSFVIFRVHDSAVRSLLKWLDLGVLLFVKNPALPTVN